MRRNGTVVSLSASRSALPRAPHIVRYHRAAGDPPFSGRL